MSEPKYVGFKESVTPEMRKPSQLKTRQIEKLLDAAFGVLAHDCDPLDHGSIKQRESLKPNSQKYCI